MSADKPARAGSAMSHASDDSIVVSGEGHAPLTVSGEMEQIREMLLGSAVREIDQLRVRVQDLEIALIESEGRTKSISEVLPDAVSSPEWEDGKLGVAMSGEVDVAVYTSARKDSDVLAEALYPVLGPAIRKMIMNIFNGGNTESSAFSVEQLLLMERRSGVLLAEVTSADRESMDADVISGMLDAIRLFVSEAFHTPEHDGLQDLRVGDTSVLVEWGPDAVLAAVATGTPPPEWRTAAADLLYRFHADFADNFSSFAGDVSAFTPAAPPMRQLLDSAALFGVEKKESSSLGPMLLAVAAVFILCLIALLVGAWIW